jgi:lipopolysaccharide biosynthesis glycosyltransferase
MSLNFQKYVATIDYCPICRAVKKTGKTNLCLIVHYTRKKPWHKWNGPYFSVVHITMSKYSPEEYAKRRASGLSWQEARELPNRTRFSGTCYIGKENPLPGLEVPHP